MPITDFESAKEWLEGQPRDVQVAFAARCALRAVPGLGTADHATLGNIALPVLRAMLTSGVAVVRTTPEVKAAAYSAAHSAAHSAAFSAARSAINSAASAASAAHSAASAAHSAASAAHSAAHSAARSAASAAHSAAFSAAHSAANFDAEQIEAEDVGSVFERALWPETDVPDFFEAPFVSLRGFWAASPEIWTFWARWYDGALNGKPMDWALQEAVTLIPNEVWEEGAEAVAEEIRKIELEWARREGIIEESLVLDTTIFVYSAVSLDVSDADRLARHLSRVDDALEDILSLAGNNGITRATADYLIIRRLVERYADDPERIAFDLTDVNHSIERQKASQEYPDSEPIRLLQTAIIGCVTHIRSSYSEIDTELSQTYPRAPEPPSEKDAEVLQTALQFSSEMQDERTAHTTVEDEVELFYNRIIDAAKDGRPDGPVQVATEYRAIVLRRQLSRLSQVARDWVSIDGLAEHYDEKHSKAAGYIGRMGGAAWVLTQAVLTLARMLGLT